MTITEAAREADAPDAPVVARRRPRVVSAAALVIGLVAVAALALPGFRHQLVLSTTHQPQSYVELYFAQAPDGTRALCSRGPEGIAVSFTMASHLDERRQLGYVVTVTGARGAGAAERREGSATVSPGASETVSATFGTPARGPYDVSVRLTDGDQMVRAHCDGGPA